jgi:hypothetical protein
VTIASGGKAVGPWMGGTPGAAPWGQGGLRNTGRVPGEEVAATMQSPNSLVPTQGEWKRDVIKATQMTDKSKTPSCASMWTWFRGVQECGRLVVSHPCGQHQNRQRPQVIPFLPRWSLVLKLTSSHRTGRDFYFI